MAPVSLNIVYVTNKAGNLTALMENGSMDTSRTVGEILQAIGAMKKFGPGSQLFISADPGRKLSDMAIPPGSTIIVMGNG